MPPLRVNAAGSSSTIATESMNPAPNATSSSMTRSSRTARRVTASAPSTLPAAAMSAYSSALDTGEEILLRVAARIREHFVEQARERFAHVRARPDPRRDQVIALHRQVLERQRRIVRSHGGHRFANRLGGADQEIIDVLAHIRHPATHLRGVFRLGIAVPPFADGATTLDITGGAFEPRQQRCGILAM